MDYHILKKHKVIFFWTPKCGVTSLIEMIMHLEDGKDHSNTGRDDKTHKDYWGNFRKWQWDGSLENEDFSQYKKIFCVRNTYHRVVSCFLDKYVDDNSPGTKDTPKCNNFYEFVKILESTNLEKEKMKGVVDYEHFCQLTENIGWEFYCKINQPEFDLIFDTPTTGLPEGKIVHDHADIKKIYKLLNLQNEYHKISHLYKQNYYSFDMWKFFKPKINFSKENFAKVSIDELKDYHGFIGKERTIPYKNFYTNKLAQIITKLYTDELSFFKEKLNIKFNLME